MKAFNCTRCGEESVLKTHIPGDITGKDHKVFECANCGQIDRQAWRRRDDSSPSRDFPLKKQQQRR